MKNSRLQNPILAFTIVFVLFLLTYLIFFSRDDGGNISNVQVTNVTSNSFTVFWQTETPTFSEIIVSENNSFLDLFPRQSSSYRSIYDDSEVIQNESGDWILDSSDRKRKNIHHVTVRNLLPNQTYYFRILGDLKSFSFGEGVKTFETSVSIENPDPIYGLALNYSEPENFASEGVVIFNIKNADEVSQKISSLIDPKNGGWQYDLSKIRKEDGSIINFSKDINSKLEIEIFTNLYEGNGFGNLTNYKPVNSVFYGVFYGQ